MGKVETFHHSRSTKYIGNISEYVLYASLCHPAEKASATGRFNQVFLVVVALSDEVFLEMIRFVYLNTCHVDQGNVKAHGLARETSRT